LSPTHVIPDEFSSGAPPAVLARTIVAADTHDVMREQLDFLIEHAQHRVRGCSQCYRYLRARAVLMEIFSTAAK